MGYSRENERQNKVLGDLISGNAPEKRVMVGYEGETEVKHGDKISPLSDIMKEARMPWFCPKCKQVMKHRLDNKTWPMYNHCFECQIKFENKMRIDGTYDAWKETKIKAGKLSYIRDQRQQVLELKEQSTPEFFEQVRPDGYSVDKDKWTMNTDNLMKKADEYLEFLDKLEDSLK